MMMRRNGGIVLSSRAAAQRRVAPIRSSLLNGAKQRRNFSSFSCILCWSSVLALLLLVCVAWASLLFHYQAQDNNNDNVIASNEIPKETPVSSLLRPADHSTETFNQQQQQPKLPPSVDALKQEFYTRFGGQQQAESFLQKSIHLFGDLDVTAGRLLRAKTHHNATFVMAFGGYSVTVGRGNHFHESFPFVMERLLREPLKDVLGIDLKVRNAAIGGIPSFPYGFCLSHFLGEDADVISWDYGMNEGGGSSILESYVRHGLSQLPKRPMLIMLDTNAARSKLLKDYHEHNMLPDCIQVAKGKEVVDKSLLDLPDEEKPEGLRDWDTFGAPDSCPGRSSWHPRKKEHEFIGWMLAMHMLKAAERAHEMIQDDEQWEAHHARELALQPFPKLLSKDAPFNPKPVMELLYGHDDGLMRHVSCRTSFLPAVDHEKVLPSIVVSGIAKGAESLDIMNERSDELYKSGWVLDVSKTERDTKKKVEKCGGLGYIDMKIALYGIPESGRLRLWLPFEGEGSPPNSRDARQWFNELIICEANEKRKDDACQLDSDITYVVGGVEVSSKSVTHVDGAGVYLKRKTCVHVGVPDGSTITELGDVKTVEGSSLTYDDRRRLVGGVQANDDEVGLLVDLTAHSKVSRANGACCISHIIWEQP